MLQGVGAAAVLACGLALLGAAYPAAPARAAATAWWGASLGAGVALGPLPMALVQAGSSWRVTYVVLAVLSAGLALAAPALLAESTLGRHRGVACWVCAGWSVSCAVAVAALGPAAAPG